MRNDDQDAAQSHSDWVRTLAEARHMTREALNEATAGVVKPNQALRRPTSPSARSHGHHVHARLHAAVIDFAEHIVVYEDDLGERLSEPITVVNFGDDQKLVTIDNLGDEWRFEYYIDTTTSKRELHGKTEEQQFYRVYLPVRACARVYKHLNQCLEELDLVAEVEEQPDADKPPAAPKHVREQAPGYNRDRATSDGGEVQ